MHIRDFRATDEAALYDVCLRTGDGGQDATGRYEDPALLGHAYAAPYARFAPSLAQVVDDDGAVAGYVLGVADTLAFERWCERQWWPALRARYPASEASFAGTPDQRIIALIHHPPVTPVELAAAYPAHLHIDLLPAAQGRGLGVRLMEGMFERLVAAGARGVHLGVDPANTRAIRFYEKLGFETVSHDRGVQLGRALP